VSAGPPTSGQSHVNSGAFPRRTDCTVMSSTRRACTYSRTGKDHPLEKGVLCNQAAALWSSLVWHCRTCWRTSAGSRRSCATPCRANMYTGCARSGRLSRRRTAGRCTPIGGNSYFKSIPPCFVATIAVCPGVHAVADQFVVSAQSEHGNDDVGDGSTYSTADVRAAEVGQVRVQEEFATSCGADSACWHARLPAPPTDRRHP
jgi:hypothetical protein